MYLAKYLLAQISPKQVSLYLRIFGLDIKGLWILLDQDGINLFAIATVQPMFLLGS
jgi:hypothetical protein